MHEMEGLRRSCADHCKQRSLATGRLTGLLHVAPASIARGCLSRNGCPEVPGYRSLGSRSPWKVRRSHPAD